MSKRVSGKGNGMYGKKHTERAKKRIGKLNKGAVAWNKGLTKEISEILKKQGDKRKGAIFTNEHIENISKGNARHWEGKKLSDEHKINIGIGNTRKQKIVACDCCQKSGGISNMVRYHFENCVHKTKAA